MPSLALRYRTDRRSLIPLFRAHGCRSLLPSLGLPSRSPCGGVSSVGLSDSRLALLGCPPALRISPSCSAALLSSVRTRPLIGVRILLRFCPPPACMSVPLIWLGSHALACSLTLAHISSARAILGSADGPGTIKSPMAPPGMHD